MSQYAEVFKKAADAVLGHAVRTNPLRPVTVNELNSILGVIHQQFREIESPYMPTPDDQHDVEFALLLAEVNARDDCHLSTESMQEHWDTCDSGVVKSDILRDIRTALDRAKENA
jgi:hypothetical protein